MQSQKITSTFQCLSILPYRTIDVKKNERLSQFLYPLTPTKTAIALIPLHCPITYPTHRYKHIPSARFRTMWAGQFIDEASTLNKRCCSNHLFLSIEKTERLNARQLRSYYGVISVFLSRRSPLQRIIRTPICFQGSYYLRVVEIRGFVGSGQGASVIAKRASLLAKCSVSPGIGVRTAIAVGVILSHIIPLYKKNIARNVRYFWWR